VGRHNDHPELGLVQHRFISIGWDQLGDHGVDPRAAARAADTQRVRTRMLQRLRANGELGVVGEVEARHLGITPSQAKHVLAGMVRDELAVYDAKASRYVATDKALNPAAKQPSKPAPRYGTVLARRLTPNASNAVGMLLSAGTSVSESTLRRGAGRPTLDALEQAGIIRRSRGGVSLTPEAYSELNGRSGRRGT
jgi:hypothetical protein